jgi:hypothetical protein
MKNKFKLPEEQVTELLKILQLRFEKNMARHQAVKWPDVEARIKSNPDKLWSLNEMEETGGEPDVVAFNKNTGEFVFYDCAPESPKGRRSVCYDPAAQESRKEFKPKNSAVGMAAEMGIELLNQEQYFQLQQFGKFDTKTSSWVKTPEDIRKLGGAIFGDWRYGKVFIYHNGAESYYAARGFRGSLTV